MSARSVIACRGRCSRSKPALDAGQHAQRQHIDLHDAERVDIVLVPLDEGAAVHGARGRSAPSRPAARASARSRRHAATDGAESRPARAPAPPCAGPPGLAGSSPISRSRRPAIARRRSSSICAASAAVASSDRPITLPTSRIAISGAVMDHRGGDAGAVAAVAVVDVLDHLLAPFVLEIDVDIRRLAPLGGNKAFEQQVDLGGIDRGDAETVAHRRIGRRTAPLAENAGAAGEVRRCRAR